LTSAWDFNFNWDLNRVPDTGDNVIIGSRGRVIYCHQYNNPTLGDLNIDGASTYDAAELRQRQDTITTTNTFVGSGGNGTYNQDGGTHTVLTDFSLAAGVGGSGTYNLAAGDLNVTRNCYVGAWGQSYFGQTGGTHSVGGDLTVGHDDAGAYSLWSGSLAVSGDEFIGKNNGSAGVFFRRRLGE
jgi:hypothetical protein